MGLPICSCLLYFFVCLFVWFNLATKVCRLFADNVTASEKSVFWYIVLIRIPSLMAVSLWRVSCCFSVFAW